MTKPKKYIASPRTYQDDDYKELSKEEKRKVRLAQCGWITATFNPYDGTLVGKNMACGLPECEYCGNKIAEKYKKRFQNIIDNFGQAKKFTVPESMDKKELYDWMEEKGIGKDDFWQIPNSDGSMSYYVESDKDISGLEQVKFDGYVNHASEVDWLEVVRSKPLERRISGNLGKDSGLVSVGSQEEDMQDIEEEAEEQEEEKDESIVELNLTALTFNPEHFKNFRAQLKEALAYAVRKTSDLDPTDKGSLQLALTERCSAFVEYLMNNVSVYCVNIGSFKAEIDLKCIKWKTLQNNITDDEIFNEFYHLVDTNKSPF